MEGKDAQSKSDSSGKGASRSLGAILYQVQCQIDPGDAGMTLRLKLGHRLAAWIMTGQASSILRGTDQK